MNLKRTVAATGIAVAASVGLASTASADTCESSWHPVIGCSGTVSCAFWQIGLNAISSDHHYVMDLGGGNYQVGYFQIFCTVVVTA